MPPAAAMERPAGAEEEEAPLAADAADVPGAEQGRSRDGEPGSAAAVTHRPSSAATASNGGTLVAPTAAAAAMG